MGWFAMRNKVVSLAARTSLQAMYRRSGVLLEKVGTNDPVRESQANRNKTTALVDDKIGFAAEELVPVCCATPGAVAVAASMVSEIIGVAVLVVVVAV